MDATRNAIEPAGVGWAPPWGQVASAAKCWRRFVKSPIEFPSGRGDPSSSYGAEFVG